MNNFNIMDMKESHMAYMKWGKGPKQPLRFSKSGVTHVEKQYATHFIVKKREAPVPDNTDIEVETKE